MLERQPEIICGGEIFARRELDIDDQQGQCDGKHTIAKGFQSCIGV